MPKNNEKKWVPILEILLLTFLGLFLRFLCRDFVSADMQNCLLPWFDKIRAMDLHTALTQQVGNYNVLYQLIIFLLTRLNGANAIYLYKAVSVIGDLALGFAVFCYALRNMDQKKAIIGYGIVMLLPTVWMNSAMWGQCDSIYVACIIGALCLLKGKKHIGAFVLLGLAFSFKLQTIFIIPLIGYYYLTQRRNEKITIWHFLLIPLVFIATGLPNLIAGRSVTDLFSIYYNQTNAYPEMVKNYPGLWNVVPLAYESGKSYGILITAIVLCCLMHIIYHWKADLTGNHFLWCAVILSFACVLCLPAMHERYSFLYEILLVLLALQNKKLWPVVGALQIITYRTYLKYLTGIIYNEQILSLANIAVFCVLVCLFFKECQKNKPVCAADETAPTVDETTQKRFSVEKHDWRTIAALTLSFFLLGLVQLGTINAPQTFVDLGAKDGVRTEEMFELEYKYDVESINIYLGESRNKKVHVFSRLDGQWKPIARDFALENEYGWNVIPVNEKGWYFDIIIEDEDVDIGEIAISTKTHGVVTPKNADDYPFLFDEQDTYIASQTYYNKMMFDEIYHGVTANEYLTGHSIYENTHPPLGKLIIAVGIWIFGMSPFGWRIMSLIFGTLMVPVIYLFALRLTHRRCLATLAGILLVTEFMHFTLSRIATIDIFVAFFVSCMLYCLLAFLQSEQKRYLILSGLFSGLGIATKWTAIYALGGMAVILLLWLIGKLRAKAKAAEIMKVIGVCVLSFILLPLTVYVLSYIPFARIYPDQSPVEHAISNSIAMFNYHSQANKPHGYASPWYSWLIDWFPLVDIRTELGEYKSVVATFVNPVVCFGGLFALVHHIYQALFKKNKKAGFLLVFYMSMLVPWMFITRTVFIYQYFICTQVLILMICNSLSMLEIKNEKRVVLYVGALAVLLFFLYFPVISGLQVSSSYIRETLKLMKYWYL